MREHSAGWSVRFIVFVFFMFSITVLRGQQPGTGKIDGQVVDPTGASIEGALVFVHRHGPSEGPLEIAAHTDKKGYFTLALPEGGYDIFVTARSFAAGVQTVPVLSGKTRRVQWKLKIVGCDFPDVNCDSFTSSKGR